MSASESVLPNTSSIFFFTDPEPFFSTWVKASYSPCTSVRKCSVPFGRFRIDDRLMISVEASAIVGYSSARRCRYRSSISCSFIVSSRFYPCNPPCRSCRHRGRCRPVPVTDGSLPPSIRDEPMNRVTPPSQSQTEKSGLSPEDPSEFPAWTACPK